jgi:hypothetical protein
LPWRLPYSLIAGHDPAIQTALDARAKPAHEGKAKFLSPASGFGARAAALIQQVQKSIQAK